MSFRIRLVSLVWAVSLIPPMVLSMLLPVSWVIAVESIAPVRSSAVPPSRDDLHAASDKAIREPKINVDERFIVSLSSAAPAPHRHHHKS